jgi:transcriptional regulator with XRE-family HTH domain
MLELLMPIGDRLRQLRKAKGLSQMALARESGLSLSIITQLEQGLTADPKLSTLKALAKALGCKIDDLAEDGEDEPPAAEPPPPTPPKRGRKGKRGGGQ